MNQNIRKWISSNSCSINSRTPEDGKIKLNQKTQIKRYRSTTNLVKRKSDTKKKKELPGDRQAKTKETEETQDSKSGSKRNEKPNLVQIKEKRDPSQNVQEKNIDPDQRQRGFRAETNQNVQRQPSPQPGTQTRGSSGRVFR